MLKIDLLNQEGETKSYTALFVGTRAFRTFLDMQSRGVLNLQTPEDMDEVVTFICDVFKNQFSMDDFYDGVPSDKFTDELESVIDKILGDNKGNADHPAKKGK